MHSRTVSIGTQEKISIYFKKKKQKTTASGHQRKLSGSGLDTTKRKYFSDSDSLNHKTGCPGMLRMSKSAQANSRRSCSRRVRMLFYPQQLQRLSVGQCTAANTLVCFLIPIVFHKANVINCLYCY